MPVTKIARRRMPNLSRIIASTARKEVMRKLFTPAPWGFGQNGFSYTRDGEGY